jgi:bifunctional non-homologous end joining protein LigD
VLLRRLIQQDPRSPIQFSDHVEGDGAGFFKAAAELGLEGIVSKRAASRYRSGASRSWLKIKNMVESEFILLGTERDDSGVPWALLAREQGGRLAFAGPAIFNPPRAARAAWVERMAELALARPPMGGLKRKAAQWLRPELRVRVQHLRARGTLRHASAKSIKGPVGKYLLLSELGRELINIIRERACLFWPQLRNSATSAVISEKCQYRSFAVSCRRYNERR